MGMYNNQLWLLVFALFFVIFLVTVNCNVLQSVREDMVTVKAKAKFLVNSNDHDVSQIISNVF